MCFIEMLPFLLIVGMSFLKYGLHSVKLFCNLYIFLRIIKNVHLLSYPAVAVDGWKGKWLFTLLLFFGCFFSPIGLKQSDWLIKSYFICTQTENPPTGCLWPQE